MDMIGRIRRLHSRGKKSEREIARLTGLSRNTISKWLREPIETAPRYRRSEGTTTLAPFHETLKLSLKVDLRRPLHGRRTAKALFAEIKAAGYKGCYSRVTDFIREWRAGEGMSVSKNAFVPLKFELGEAFQFDWSEEGLVVGGLGGQAGHGGGIRIRGRALGFRPLILLASGDRLSGGVRLFRMGRGWKVGGGGSNEPGRQRADGVHRVRALRQCQSIAPLSVEQRRVRAGLDQQRADARLVAGRGDHQRGQALRVARVEIVAAPDVHQHGGFDAGPRRHPKKAVERSGGQRRGLAQSSAPRSLSMRGLATTRAWRGAVLLNDRLAINRRPPVAMTALLDRCIKFYRPSDSRRSVVGLCLRPISRAPLLRYLQSTGANFFGTATGGKRAEIWEGRYSSLGAMMALSPAGPMKAAASRPGTPAEHSKLSLKS